MLVLQGRQGLNTAGLSGLVGAGGEGRGGIEGRGLCLMLELQGMHGLCTLTAGHVGVWELVQSAAPLSRRQRPTELR